VAQQGRQPVLPRNRVVIEERDNLTARRLDTAVPRAGNATSADVGYRYDVMELAGNLLKQLRVMVNNNDNLQGRHGLRPH
jgi:hypothetical protein